nr:hypothetical protein CFP56_40429 [Quercus suber]
MYGDQNSQPTPSSSVHDEGRLTEPILNLETAVLVEKNSLGSSTQNLAPTSGGIINPVSDTSYMEHDSSESQIQDIDTELTKFDRLGEVNQEAEIQEPISHSNIEPNDGVTGVTSDETATTLPSLETTQPNPTSRKWKQLARQVHVGDSSMQSMLARKRSSEECGWGQTDEPSKKIQLSEDCDLSNSMVEAVKQPCQDQ